MSNDWVIVPKSEYEIKKWEVIFTAQDMEDIIEKREAFMKFLEKSIHKYQSDHWKLLDIGKEAETYIAIRTIQQLILSIDGTYNEYKRYMEEEKLRKEWKIAE